MANSFKSFFSKIVNKDERQASKPSVKHDKQVDDLKNMEINLDSSDIKDDLDLDEIDKNQQKPNKPSGKVDTVILDFDNIDHKTVEEKTKQSFETVSDEEKDTTVDPESNKSSQTPRKARFLIVDDANFMRILLRKILEEEGFEVIGEASNGEEAIEKVNELSPDIVTMDITMPEMDGITALKEILVIKPKIKVIMCSAINQREMVLDALKIGAKDFISKPFEQNKVSDVIKRVVEMK